MVHSCDYADKQATLQRLFFLLTKQQQTQKTMTKKRNHREAEMRALDKIRNVKRFRLASDLYDENADKVQYCYYLLFV